MVFEIPQEDLDKVTKDDIAQRFLAIREENRLYSSKIYTQREEIYVLNDDVKRYKRIIDNLMEQV